MIRLISCAVLALSLCGCSSADERLIAPPTAPTSPLTPPAPSPSSGLTLSGVVFESTAQAARPLSGSRVYYSVADSTTWGSVLTDANGRYLVPNAPNERRVRVTAFADITNGHLFQRSATIATIQGDTVLDIELVARGIRGITYGSPTLSGVVYRVTPEGRQPIVNTRVVYKSFDTPPYDVYLETDGRGRFDFSRLPLGSGQLGAGNCNDQMMFLPVDIHGDTVSDIDITWLFSSCPGIPY